MVQAGDVTELMGDDSKPAMRLTQRGAQVGRAMAMAGQDADAEAVLNVLLDAAEGGTLPG